VIETDNYYRRRFEEELAAAAEAKEPSISHIHLEMARRYRDRLDSRAIGDAISVEPRGEAFAGSGGGHA
jgi:hypothetical protein